MLQEIIAYTIISIAFGILILNILRFFNLIGKKTAISSKCGGCSSGCEIKNINFTGKTRIGKPDQYKFYL